MDYAFLFLTILLTILITKICLKLCKPTKNLPPSPRFCFPIIGHLLLLRKTPLLHRTLRSLSHSLGPVFSLRLGSRLAVFVSSPAMAEECFLTQNDVVLANRPRFIIGQYMTYDYTSMVTAPYGDHWRNLRRITALEVFSTSRLSGSAEIRQDEVKRLLQKLHGLSVERPAKVELRSLLTDITLNVVLRMVTGKRYFEEKEEGGKAGISKEFRELVTETLEVATVDHPADFLPALRLFDFKGLVKKGKRIGEKMDSFLQGFLDEHRANKEKLEFKNTMIAHLLDSQEKEPHFYNDVTIKGLILMMVIGGTDTSALTVEWAMSNFFNHPQVLKTTRQHIDNYMESSSSSNRRRLLKEEDSMNINYLNNVVSETLRLYPVAPLMVPHFSSSDCVIGGFDIPRGTIVMVNLWAIHRDPSVWDDPISFKPERFEERESGQYSGKMMPFGLGRRVCPGSGLANRVVGLLLGSMIQCFEWESGSGGPVDMYEGPGLSMPKAEPLVVTCRPREIASELLF